MVKQGQSLEEALGENGQWGGRPEQQKALLKLKPSAAEDAAALLDSLPPPPAPKGGEFCRNFLKTGTCRYGDKCNYQHAA